VSLRYTAYLGFCESTTAIDSLATETTLSLPQPGSFPKLLANGQQAEGGFIEATCFAIEGQGVE
jgi:hypothetical protein